MCVCVCAVRPLIRYDFRRISAPALDAAGSSWSIFLPRSPVPSAAEVDDQFRASTTTTRTHFRHLIYNHNLACIAAELQLHISATLRGRNKLYQLWNASVLSDLFRQCHPKCIERISDCWHILSVFFWAWSLRLACRLSWLSCLILYNIWLRRHV